MSTVTDIDTDLVTIEHLDFATPCMVRLASARNIVQPRCELPATWSMRCQSCGDMGACCDSHRAQIIGCLFITCSACRVTTSALTLYSFSPLGGA